MRRTKTQRATGEQMSSKPLYDPHALQAVINRVQDEALRDFLVGVVDVVTGISMAQQVRNADEREEVFRAIQDIRLQIATANTARQANHAQLEGFFDRLFAQLDALAAHAERTDVRVAALEARGTTTDARIAALEGRVTDIEHRMTRG